MRASTSCLVSILGVLTVFAPSAPVQAFAAMACATDMPCVGTGSICVMPDGGMRGLCVPAGCGGTAGDVAALRDACLGDGATLDAQFRAGDCDGDLIPNGDEPTAAELCDGAAVVALDAVVGRASWHAPQRLDGAGAQIAPYDAYSTLRGAIGIGCSATRACPVLPSGPSTLLSRCIYLGDDPVAGGAFGVCTYFNLGGEDRSCLSGPLPAGGACIATDAGEPHAQWEHGDCDGDGLINKLDPHVCAQLEIVGALSGGPMGVATACRLGRLDTGSLCDGSEVGEVSSDTWACQGSPTVPPGAFTPFAFCCHSYEDCPPPPTLEPPFARCVFFGESGGVPYGACTYDGEHHPDDTSCARSALLPNACFGGSDAVSYSTWAEGNCDGCEGVDRADPFVCACDPDAGAGALDASIEPNRDAFFPSLEAGVDEGGVSFDDAATSSLDASSTGGMDAGPPGSFAGSGCRCAAAGRGADDSGAFWLTTVALGLAFARRRLRARRG